AVVAVLDVGAQIVAVVAAADLDRLEASRFEVLGDNVFVVVLAVDLELDLDQLAAFQGGSLGQQLATVVFDFLIHRLPAAAGHAHGLVVALQPIHFAIDLDLQTRAGYRVLEREVAQVGIVVKRPFALLGEETVCDPVSTSLPSSTKALSKRNRSAGVIFTSLRVWPSRAIATLMSGRSSPLARR